MARQWSAPAPDRLMNVIQSLELMTRLVSIPLALTAVILTAQVWKSQRDLMLFLLAVSHTALSSRITIANAMRKVVLLNTLQHH
jgi:hypothetical protein